MLHRKPILKDPQRRAALWVSCCLLLLLTACAAPDAPDTAAPPAASAVSQADDAAQADPVPSASRPLDAEVIPLETPQDADEPAGQTLTLMAVGDNLIHNTVYWSAQTDDGGYDFTPFYKDIAPVVAQYDLACINQETILVASPEHYGNYPRFGSPTQVADAVVDAGFNIVTHATNHCYDQGLTGITDSCAYWREHHPEITVLGIHDTPEDAATLRVVEKNGLRVALLNYTYGLNYEQPTEPWLVDTLDRDRVAADLSAARDAADFVIVFVHWGEEGEFSPNASQRDWAAFFAEQNVDVVIGAHPHVVQPLEFCTRADGKSMPVFYSLGNFLSHQMSAEQMLGGLASVQLVKDAQGTRVNDVQLLPTVNYLHHNDAGGMWLYQPMLLSDYTAEMAATHRFPAATVEYLTTLFETITAQ